MSVNSVTFLNFVRTVYLGTNVRTFDPVYTANFVVNIVLQEVSQKIAEIKMYKEMRVTNFDSLKRGQNETLTF